MQLINQLSYYEKIQRQIARRWDKVAYHFKKWENFLTILKDNWSKVEPT